jgi:hypothetical protein
MTWRSLRCFLSLFQAIPRRLCLAGTLAPALVFGELDPETLLRVANPLDRTTGHLERPIAKSTDSDGGDGAHPFDHPKITLWHGQLFRRQRCGKLSSWRIGTLKLQPWRGRLWLFYRPSVSPCGQVPTGVAIWYRCGFQTASDSDSRKLKTGNSFTLDDKFIAESMGRRRQNRHGETECHNSHDRSIPYAAL